MYCCMPQLWCLVALYMEYDNPITYLPHNIFTIGMKCSVNAVVHRCDIYIYIYVLQSFIQYIGLLSVLLVK